MISRPASRTTTGVPQEEPARGLDWESVNGSAALRRCERAERVLRMASSRPATSKPERRGPIAAVHHETPTATTRTRTTGSGSGGTGGTSPESPRSQVSSTQPRVSPTENAMARPETQRAAPTTGRSLLSAGSPHDVEFQNLATTSGTTQTPADSADTQVPLADSART